MVKPNPILSESKAKKLEYLNSLKYDILIRQKEGKFCLYIPEISLVATGDDLNQVYNDLYKQKQTFFNKILDCEAQDEVALPHKRAQVQKTFCQLRMFVCKLLIICLLGGTILVFGGVVIRNKIAEVSAGDIATKITRSIVLEAKKFTTITEEHKQMKLIKLREFLEAFRPWIDEFKAAFSSPADEKKKR